ncbi:MAG: acyltransferase family protein [Pseudomonadota bacterium]
MARRFDLDWLRVLLFGLLVLHHTAVGFAPFGQAIYGFANDTGGGPPMALAIYWSHGWRLPALFLIAGIGTWFATARGAGAGFMARRITRLLVPFLVGSLVLNLAAGLAVIAILGIEDPDLSSGPEWWLPMPPFLAMHLWFLGNLALYTLLCWPLFLVRERLMALSALPVGWFVAALAAAVTAIAVATKPFGAAVTGEGYQLYWYAGIFAGGYVIGAHHTAVLDWAARWVWWLLALGFVLFSTEVTLIETARLTSDARAEAYAAGGWATRGLAPPFGAQAVAQTAVEGLNAWAWFLAALGLAARYLNQDGPWLRTLSPAVFPVYVLHFPVVLIGLALLSLVPWPWPLELLLLAVATFTLSGLGYLATTRMGPLAFAFGGRAQIASGSTSKA